MNCICYLPLSAPSVILCLSAAPEFCTASMLGSRLPVLTNANTSTLHRMHEINPADRAASRTPQSTY
ncbi:hypothetical protein BKA67DRAFT_563883 [Truncatella angustata]|uniref:Secreted protein n=1 Tax=Truncatella angustata TaxID=152316 RepID=A0A9P8ZXH1_9PEZI|nr:uncharacterized protein BKA67DRAFT_563883 [Truncatella angustata]KAH6653989.1 hypothetical protein BKA67DRAFT_563883 [Truncatella angustata]